MSWSYKVNHDEYVERVMRMYQATHGSTLDPKLMASIKDEVGPIEGLVHGKVYRIAAIGGPIVEKLLHGVDQAGTHHTFTVPRIDDTEFVRFEATYAGRFTEGRWKGLHAFVRADQAVAALADMDVYEAEEVES